MIRVADVVNGSVYQIHHAAAKDGTAVFPKRKQFVHSLLVKRMDSLEDAWELLVKNAVHPRQDALLVRVNAEQQVHARTRKQAIE